MAADERMTCAYSGREGGAYVLGALGPLERAEFERHLTGCTRCQAEVAQLTVLPGLLGRIDLSTVEELDAVPEPRDVRPSQPPPDVRQPDTWQSGRDDRVLRALSAAASHRDRDRRRLRRWIASAAVATVAALAGAAALVGNWPAAGPPLAQVTTPPAVSASLARMIPAPGSSATSPVTALIALAETVGGTEVTMSCTYDDSDYNAVWTFRLVAVARDGSQDQVGSWTAGPGDRVRFNGLTRFARADIARVELRRGDGTPLLVYRTV